MDKEMKRRISILIIGIIGIVLLLTGISYAMFSANLTGTQVQGMQVGCLKVEMADNGNLELTNKAPETDESGLSGDAYTYTLTNTCSVNAFYTTTINVLEGSNLDNVTKVKLALGGDSYLAPTVEDDLEEIDSIDTSETNIEKTYVLDSGYLETGDSKTFELRTWIDYDVEEITGSLENKVIVLSEARGNNGIAYSTDTAGYQVLKNNDFITNVNYNSIAPSANQISGIVKVTIDNEIKYYFRGNPNNYLTFAGKNFRILSTNTDGSINIVLDDVLTNVTYANVQTSLNSFYNTVSSMESYIKTDAKFCIENDSAYSAKLKVEKSNPTGKCDSGNYMTKVGLLTTDDLMFAGAKTGTANTSFYLAGSIGYYTSSYETSSKIYGYSTTNSIVSGNLTTSNGIKPIITLKSNTLINGEGTSSQPFYVSGTYETANDQYTDDIAPTIVYARVDERWSNEDKQIEISAQDNSSGSGIAGYLIKNSSSKPSATDAGWEASVSQKYMSVNSYNNGIYYVFAKDAAGNISEGATVRVEKVDKTAPTCTIKINPNGTATYYKTLTIETEENNIDLEGYSWDHTKSTESVTKVEENMVYTGYITDLAGNKGSCSATITNIIDNSTAAGLIKAKIGKSGLEEVTHTADSTLQIGTTEDIVEYRFRGGNNVVTNNYVYFNCDDIKNQTANTCDLYRIIGVFPTDDGTGNLENRVKLIKATAYNDTTYSWDTSGSNNWTRPSTLNTELNDTYYDSLSNEYKELIGTTKYYLARNNTTYATVASIWGAERKQTDESGNPVSFIDEIALMYTSDFGYAAVGCEDNYLERTSSTNVDIRECKDDNWLFIGEEWTLNARQNNTTNAFIVHNEGYVGYSGSVSADRTSSARPVFYLKSESAFNIDNGDGSQNNPYQLMKYS